MAAENMEKYLVVHCVSKQACNVLLLIHSFNCVTILILRAVAILNKNNKIFKCKNKISFICS
jgi:hypothetical protein